MVYLESVIWWFKSFCVHLFISSHSAVSIICVVLYCACSVLLYVHNVYISLWSVTSGSCRDLLHAHFKDGLPEMAAAYILRDVLQAVNYLHNRGIIHRSVWQLYLVFLPLSSNRQHSEINDFGLFWFFVFCVSYQAFFSVKVKLSALLLIVCVHCLERPWPKWSVMCLVLSHPLSLVSVLSLIREFS